MHSEPESYAGEHGTSDLEVTGHKYRTLQAVLAVIFEMNGNCTPCGVYSDKLKGLPALVFVWHVDGLANKVGAQDFGGHVNQSTVAEIIVRWLNKQTYPKAPDTDGSVSRGFMLTTRGQYESSPVVGNFYAVFAVCPHWIVHGK
jgi:hypothetical protein